MRTFLAILVITTSTVAGVIVTMVTNMSGLQSLPHSFVFGVIGGYVAGKIMDDR